MLATWANSRDEWARYIVRTVLSTGRPLTLDNAEHAYQLFRQEKLVDERELQVEPPLEIEASSDTAERPLAIVRISDVTGVNALAPLGR